MRRKLLVHASFFVMLLSSGAIYVSNFFLASALSLNDYGYYALLVTFLSVASSYGLGGFDQAIVRTAREVDGCLKVNSILFFLSILSSFVFGVLAFLYFDSLADGSGLFAAISGFFVSIGLFGYAVGRVKKLFVFAQFSHGGYRITFAICVLVAWVAGAELNAKAIDGLFIISSGVVALFVVVFLLYRVSTSLEGAGAESVLGFAVGYGMSMLLMNIIGYGDRVLIERFFGLESAAAYFFYANIYVFPFSLLQAYVGFKELARYKESFSLGVFHGDMFRALKVFCGVLVLCVLVDFLLTKYFFAGVFDFGVADRVLLIALGGMRIVYGLLSAALGARALPTAIHQVNGITVLAVLSTGGAFWFVDDKTLVWLILCFLTAWIARAMSVYYLVCKQDYRGR